MDGRHRRLIQVRPRGQGHALVRVHCLALVLTPTLARILVVLALVLDPSLVHALVLAPHRRPPRLAPPAPAVAALLLPAKGLSISFSVFFGVAVGFGKYDAFHGHVFNY